MTQLMDNINSQTGKNQRTKNVQKKSRHEKSSDIGNIDTLIGARAKGDPVLFTLV